MKSRKLALLGGKAAFAMPLPVGQLYFPSWDRYESAMRGIFERRYYTNHGPLVQQLETRLQDFLGVRHVICVTNATIGLMMAADAMRLSGKVVMPSFTFIASAQSLSWAGIEPVFCDVDQTTHQIDINKIEALLDGSVSGIMGVNLWGGACTPLVLEEFARDHELGLYFDSAHAFGCEVNHRRIGAFGSLEVFSFHATKILNATEGGCISTNDDVLADRLRNIRSSYGVGKVVPILRTSNGRMSEAQAAIALMSLDDFPNNQKNNEKLFRTYEEKLKHIDGLKLVRPYGVSFSNYQYLVCELDENAFGLSRDSLVVALKAENVNARRYFYPGTHRSVDFRKQFSERAHALPVTDHLCGSCIQLPVGAMMDCDAVDTICEIIDSIRKNSHLVKSFLAGGAK